MRFHVGLLWKETFRFPTIYRWHTDIFCSHVRDFHITLRETKWCCWQICWFPLLWFLRFRFSFVTWNEDFSFKIKKIPSVVFLKTLDYKAMSQYSWSKEMAWVFLDHWTCKGLAKDRSILVDRVDLRTEKFGHLRRDSCRCEMRTWLILQWSL